LWRAVREGADAPDLGRASAGEWAELRAALRELLPGVEQAALVRHEGIEVEIDALERAAGGVRAVLLVADDKPRDADRDRAALCWLALRGGGARTIRVELWHPDPRRARGPDGIDWSRFFRRVDVTRDAELLAEDVGSDVPRLLPLLGDTARPEVEPSPHCFRPAPCPYRDDCTRGRLRGWIGELPRLRPEQDYALRELGVERIADIPGDFSLAPEQRAARNAVRAGGRWTSAQLGERLLGCGPPSAFLDFEAMAPAVPLYPGTRPFQVIPVQFSLRALDRSGSMRRRDFLAEVDRDPRAAFADALIEQSGPPELPILVYSEFESEVLADLASALPDRSDKLMRLRARLRDLQGILRMHAYRLEQRGAYGLKRVLPAFAPDFGWDDLPLASGAAAHDTWLAIARGELVGEAAERAKAELSDYCARDTEALEVLLGALRAPG